MLDRHKPLWRRAMAGVPRELTEVMTAFSFSHSTLILDIIFINSCIRGSNGSTRPKSLTDIVCLKWIISISNVRNDDSIPVIISFSHN